MSSRPAPGGPRRAPRARTDDRSHKPRRETTRDARGPRVPGRGTLFPDPGTRTGARGVTLRVDKPRFEATANQKKGGGRATHSECVDTTPERSAR